MHRMSGIKDDGGAEGYSCRCLNRRRSANTPQSLDSCAGAWLGGRSISDGVETSLPRKYNVLPYYSDRTTCQLRFQLSPGKCERVRVRGLSHEGEGGGGVVDGLLKYKQQ
jgi:hypothetical protein